MRVAIDMQGLQSTSAKRGIGRYTTGLIKAMLHLKGDNEVILILNGELKDSIQHIRHEFSDYIDKQNIYVWSSLAGVNPNNIQRQQNAEKIREAFISRLNPDLVLITSFFEGYSDDAVTSIGSFTSRIPTAVIFYDLIPYIHADLYLSDESIKKWYFDKIDKLSKADLYLSISESSRKEAINYLNYDENSVVNISTACDELFKPIVLDDEARGFLEKKYRIKKDFVLYTGGVDYRKNIEGLIHAFSLLPPPLRNKHQLAIVCSIQLIDKDKLHQLAKSYGLSEDDVVITGFVPDNDLLMLYNACKVFVFPSWHEGFGLPALEAMTCGRAVIGSNRSSIPEVIGREDALFDPYDDNIIAVNLERVLSDDLYRSELEVHGLNQARKFSWINSAEKAWSAITNLTTKSLSDLDSPLYEVNKPSLAYLSPLPAVKSGISDYSSELLPILANYYDITIVNGQEDEITSDWIKNNCKVRTIDWFIKNNSFCDRVLYHFGNSTFHSHMFSLLSKIPGTVVLHDFFLSGVLYHNDVNNIDEVDSWTRELLISHGWSAVSARFKSNNISDVIYAYPCNLNVLRNALGIIVHSDYSRNLASTYYNKDTSKDWDVIPLMKAPAENINRNEAREILGISTDEFLVCTFGLLGPTKLNHRLLSSWSSSLLSQDPKCRLVFVGENNDGTYGNQLLKNIKNHGQNRVSITGWVDRDLYHTWLAAADVAVQLRTLSRGETSAAVLDCMSYGLATIINANGSMANLPESVVYKLNDDFDDEQLSDALTLLWQDNERRNLLGTSALRHICVQHRPQACVKLYHDAIERNHENAKLSLKCLIEKLSVTNDKYELTQLAIALSENFEPNPRLKQLLFDVTPFVYSESDSLNTLRPILERLLLENPKGWVVEPVYFDRKTSSYMYARKFTCQFLDIPSSWIEDCPAESWRGDVFLGNIVESFEMESQGEYLLYWFYRGVSIFFMTPDFLYLADKSFDIESSLVLLDKSIDFITNFSGVICASEFSKNKLVKYSEEQVNGKNDDFIISEFLSENNITITDSVGDSVRFIYDFLECVNRGR
ncbi:glycosyltransferase [Yersinia frederiksenii]|uniref:glycosyltransferase n=1 Tax=Yersinia frederiksenii TaxID=29484 RepID=UPI0005E69D13|nr:glycosyltransferase [Yersinia frederiksenii]CNF03584.1 mannosyltransferase [Yersinia frederiksenii]